MNPRELWDRYKRYLCVAERIGLRMDVSRMRFDDSILDRLAGPMSAALAAMQALERGAIANADERRMVGHYWSRAPQLAPDPAIRTAIEKSIASVKRFAADVHDGTVAPQRGDGFFVILLIGIGGSTLGAQLMCDCLGSLDDAMVVRFLDNTDPDGIDRVLSELNDGLEETLTVVVSKSGTTTETYNAVLETAAAYRRLGLDFAKHAVAVTSEGSALYRRALDEKWLKVFPMWDWVGGRTSAFSAAGLLPAALQGTDVDALLAGARECDIVTRGEVILQNQYQNPAALLAMMWYHAGSGRGERNMVVLPYRDRLCLLGRYLQQLVMESLGKEYDRAGSLVHQGLTVYGQKGTTDQHAFVQQLRDGRNDFFVTFIEVLTDRVTTSMRVGEEVTTGDYLSAFLHGTRSALHEKDRESITITLDALHASSLGALIALFERAVGLYAELINVNAYHQPGVEAGKQAAVQWIERQRAILACLRSRRGVGMTVEQVAVAIGRPDSTEEIYHILEHVAANPDHGIAKTKGANLFDGKYAAS